MSANEELHEQIHAARDPFERTVAASVAIIAALLAIVSVVGQHFNTEELLREQESADQWAFAQAKDIRRYSAQIAQDTLTASKADRVLVQRYANEGARYDKERREIQQQARELHGESEKSGRRANRFHFAEVLLEIAIVLSSLAILSKSLYFFWIGTGASLAGVLLALTAFFR
jgi:hypothetical protein